MAFHRATRRYSAATRTRWRRQVASGMALLGRRSVRLSGVLALLSGVDILLSVVYQWYFLRRIGPGAQTDALYAGMMVPQLVLIVLTGSLIQVLVPLLAVQGEEEFAQSVWTVLHAVALSFGGLVVIAWLGAGFWVPLTVPGFTDATTRLTVHLVRIQLLGLFLAALSTVLWAAHQARYRFIWSTVSPLIAGLVGLGVLIWGLPRFGVSAAAWSGVCRGGVFTLLLLPGTGTFHRPRWRTPVMREAWRRMRPLLSRSIYFKADVVVDRFLAALAPPGALSLLTLARQLYTAGLGVMNKAVTAPSIPTLAQLAERQAWGDFRRIRNRRALWCTIGALGLFFVLLAAGRPVLSFFFAHSSFRTEQVDQTWGLLVVLSGVWVAGSSSQILAGALYAQGDTETPTRVGVIGFTVGVVLKVLGYYVLGVWGIAAGASLHYLLMAGLLLHASRRLPPLTPGGEMAVQRGTGTGPTTHESGIDVASSASRR